MAAPTFTPGDNKQDEKLNPGQRDYDRRFNDIARKEEHGTFDDIAKNYDQEASSAQEDANIEQLRNQESNGTQDPISGQDGGWANNVSSGGSKIAATGRERVKGWFRKASPAVGVGGIVGIGGLILVGLSSPSLLIVQLKETMVGRFNTQLSSMEARTNRLIYAKMNGATKGFCSTSVSIRCKFSTMSEKQIERMKAAGIEVKGETSIGSRIKPTSMEFNGKSITARDFYSTAGQDVKFRSALKLAYNPKFAGFGGAAWEAIAARFKISKLAPELNADSDPEAAREKINQIAKEGTSDSGTRSRVTGDAPDCEENCSGISEEEAERINADAGEIEAGAKDGSAANDVRSRLSGLNMKVSSSFFNAFKVTAPFDYACQGYGALTTLSYAAKAIRAAQLVRYGMIFLSTADMIKAGQSPEPEDVALLGTILTTTLADSEGNTLVGSATDSFGYKYAAYGDSGAPEKSMQNANRFMVGSGFVGTMSAVTNAVLAPLGGRESARQTCGALANPLVQGASVVLGVASLFVPGANVAKIASTAAAGAAVTAAIAVLPGLLADIVAGSVTDDIVGEESGNALTSASGHLISDALAAHNGNGPMTKEDAIAYNESQIEVQNQYIADELRETSPFDATNPHLLK